jgi:hypothetical protein
MPELTEIIISYAAKDIFITANYIDLKYNFGGINSRRRK